MSFTFTHILYSLVYHTFQTPRRGHENTQKYCISYFDSKTWAGRRGPPSGGYFGVSLDIIGRFAITVAYIIIIAVFQQVTASGSELLMVPLP